MSENFIMAIGKDAIAVALKVSAPILIVSMAIGLLISIFQAATQIQEQTLTFVPKMIAIIVVLLLLGSWMLNLLIEFTQGMINNIGSVIR